MATPLLLTGFLLSGLPAFDAPQGEYVEARTASVFAGACHYGGEYTTQGRRAVMGWSLESGLEAGVDLSGITIVALVDCEENLAELDEPRKAVVHVTAGGARLDAAMSWLRREQGSTLGEILAVHGDADLTVDVEGDDFQLHAPSTSLVGDALADHACCKMPLNVLYDPLQSLTSRLVGRPAEFLVDEPRLHWKLNRAGDNNVFFGRFGQ